MCNSCRKVLHYV
ncbi:hypothetical protein F3J02_12060 [Acinetobacter sp. Tr-809]|nr:hypothetical protein [Acinetobacter sp. Tr-809]QHH95934.1 hypothetical protein FPL18_11270 [Acinetobacter gyllenbergii]QHH99605.1 hypothetical protein FPL17_18700 [Acinetobacter dispersus]